MIFKDGVPMRKVAGENIVEAFVMETEKLLAEIKNKPQIDADLSSHGLTQILPASNKSVTNPR